MADEFFREASCDLGIWTEGRSQSSTRRYRSIINGLVTLAWIGLYTYVVLDLATYCLHKLGLPDNHLTKYSVAAAIMIIQLIIGTLGFYAIRTFEKWTVPVLAVVMAAMTVL